MNRSTLVVLTLTGVAALGTLRLLHGHGSPEPAAYGCSIAPQAAEGDVVRFTSDATTTAINQSFAPIAAADGAPGFNELSSLARTSHRRPGRPVAKPELQTTREGMLTAYRLPQKYLPHIPYDDLSKLNGFCPADIDKNNVIDAADAAFFVELWQDESHELTGWADINTDGFIDSDDVLEFMHRYIENDCDPQEQVARRGEWC